MPTNSRYPQEQRALHSNSSEQHKPQHDKLVVLIWQNGLGIFRLQQLQNLYGRMSHRK